MKKILCLYNPISSSGKSEALSALFAKALREHDYVVTRSKTPYEEASLKKLESELGAYDLVVTFTGDGSLLKLYSLLIQAECPLYAVPMGNESLFSVEFGFDRDWASLIAAIQARRIEECTLGFFTTGSGIKHYFFSMLEVDGLFSKTVARITKRRRGPLNNLSYAWHGFITFLNYTFKLRDKNPFLTIAVDGKEVVTKQAGSLLIANTSNYARGSNVAQQASPMNTTLDLVFHPQTTVFSYLLRLLNLARSRSPEKWIRESLTLSGEEIAITVEGTQFPWQYDGDLVEEACRKIEVDVAPKRLKVLVPSFESA